MFIVKAITLKHWLMSPAKKEREGLRPFLEISESNWTFDSIVGLFHAKAKVNFSSDVFRLLGECNAQKTHGSLAGLQAT